MNKFDGPDNSNFQQITAVIKNFSNEASSTVGRRTKRSHYLSLAEYCNDTAFVKKIDLIGRDQTLTDIRSHLSGLRAEGRQGWVCLWGPGGIGKTQLAASYALQSGPLYSRVFKICGTSPESIQEEFASLVDTQAKSLQDPNGHENIPGWPPNDSTPEFRQKVLQKRVDMAHGWFRTHKEWLLVIDDVRLPEADLKRYLPQTTHGDIIITTQSRDLVGGGLLLEVPPLTTNDAVTLLLNKANKRDKKSRDVARPRATEIVELLGCLPLAVEHAGALIGIKGMQYFWEMFHSSPITVLDQSDIMAAHQESVFRTFKMSFDVLKGNNICAAKFLVFLAFLDNTTVSSDTFLDEYGVPKSSLRHMGLFETKAEFHSAVGDLWKLALINRKDEDDTELWLHPLVHRMTRARLPNPYLINWTKNAAEYLYWPLSQPLPAPTAVQVSLFTFKCILQVLKQAAELDTPQPVTDTFLRLWLLLGITLLNSYSYWHIYGKIELQERYAKRAVAVLEQHSDPVVQGVVAALVILISELTRYTNTSDTPESVVKSFLPKHLRPAAAMALERAAHRGTEGLKSIEPVRLLWAYRPRTLQAVFKTNMPTNIVAGIGQMLSHVALQRAANSYWHEALVLAQFAELPASLWWKPPRTGLPVSRLVTAAFHASSGGDVAEYLGILGSIKSKTNDEYSTMAAYESARILLKQGRFTEAEVNLVSARDALLKESTFSLMTIKGTMYLWIIKTLSLVRVYLKRKDDASRSKSLVAVNTNRM